eukprot:364860-Chlamydomonas_euryale.AAC.5
MASRALGRLHDPQKQDSKACACANRPKTGPRGAVHIHLRTTKNAFTRLAGAVLFPSDAAAAYSPIERTLSRSPENAPVRSSVRDVSRLLPARRGGRSFWVERA